MARARNGKPVKPAAKPTVKRVAKVKPKSSAQEPARRKTKRTMTKRSMVEQVQMSQRIAAARLKPKPDTWKVIAQREGIPERTAYEMYARYRSEISKLGDNTGMATLTETLLVWEKIIRHLSWLSAHADSDATQVGASRSLMDALRGRVEILAVMGRMPRSFRGAEELAALQRLIRRMAEIIERRGFEPEVVQEFLALVDEVQPVIEGRSAPALAGASDG